MKINKIKIIKYETKTEQEFYKSKGGMNTETNSTEPEDLNKDIKTLRPEQEWYNQFSFTQK